MPKIPGLQLRRKSYYVRVRIPSDLRSIYGRKKEIVRTLETRDYTVACERIHLERAKIQAEFDSKRQQLTAANQDSDMLSAYDDHQLAALSLKWFSETVKKQREANLNDDRDLTPEERQEVLSSLKKDKWRYHQEILNQSHDGLHNGQSTAAHYLRRQGVTFKSDSLAFKKLGHLFSQAAFEMTTATLMQWQGKVYQSSMLSVPLPDYHGIQPKNHRTLQQVMDEYMADPEVRRGISTEKNYVIIHRALGELLGMDKKVHEITREDVKAVRDLLRRIPSNATKKAPNKPLKVAADLAASNKWPLLSDATVNMYLDKLRSILNFARREQYMRDAPAEGIKVKDTQSKKSKRQPFTLQHLSKIFFAPNYLNEAEYGTGRPSRYWTPLISLYTGLRLNEVCQLTVADFQDRDGICVIQVKHDDKQLKTEASERYVPIHPELKEAGLLIYVELLRKNEQKLLFPELTKDAQGYYSGATSKWFTRLLKDCEIKTRKLSFHSFRHTFREALRKVHTPRDVAHTLGGWSQGEVADDYGWGEDSVLSLNAKDLYDAIAKVDYPGFKPTPYAGL
ncbi:MAG: DUF6538 domain-containing protein [Alphaproteobacteria bacterium]